MRTQKQFEHAYMEHSDKIYRFLYWQTRDAALAEDLTSDVFIRAWRSREQFVTGSLRAWLFRIARNLTVDYYRKQRSLSLEELEIEPGYEPDFAARIDHDLQMRKLGKALAAIADPGKTIIILRFIENMPAATVADIMGITEANVRVIQHRALKMLKTKMDQL